MDDYLEVVNSDGTSFSSSAYTFIRKIFEFIYFGFSDHTNFGKRLTFWSMMGGMVNMWSYIISIESIDIYVFSEIKKLNKQETMYIGHFV